MPRKTICRSFTRYFLIVFTLLLGCKAGGNSAGYSQPSFDGLVKARLGAKYAVESNVSKTYALCQQKRDTDHLGQEFKYIVIRLSDNAIVNEGSFSMGHVRWVDDQTIEVVTSSLNKNDGDGQRKRIIRVNSGQH